jgi:hypothetical protein
MELSPSSQTASCAATQEFTNVLWNPEGSLPCSQEPFTGQDRSSQHHPILSLLRSILILSTHLHFCLPSFLFPSGLSTKILYTLLFSPPCYMHCQSYTRRLYHSNYTRRRVQGVYLISETGYVSSTMCRGRGKYHTESGPIRKRYLDHALWSLSDRPSWAWSFFPLVPDDGIGSSFFPFFCEVVHNAVGG